MPGGPEDGRRNRRQEAAVDGVVYVSDVPGKPSVHGPGRRQHPGQSVQPAIQGGDGEPLT